jgi:hypothetical protein
MFRPMRLCVVLVARSIGVTAGIALALLAAALLAGAG